MAISNLDTVQSLFVGQGDLIVFDTIANADYPTATLASLVNPKSLGQIVADSSNWTGDDVSFDEIRDEQGDLITVMTTAGTLGFEFDIASVSADMIEKFMRGTKFATANVASVWETPSGGTAPTVSAIGFGTRNPVITAPIGWLNDELNRMLLFPKAKIAANFSNSDKLMRIHCIVTAEQVDTAALKTGMIFDSSAAASYSA